MAGVPAATSATLAAAFKSALLAQGTVVFLIFVLLAISWVACRELLLAKARARLLGRLAASRAARLPEPTWRRVLRLGFGILWILDGLLQAQPTMPGGLPSHVLAAAVSGSPDWVVRTVGWAAAVWSAHPVEAAAGAVWVQLGIGVWLLSAASPRWSRAAGLVSLGWGLTVWVFGEAFGSMLAPGVSWLTGAPGAAVFYCAAGLLLALPPSSWHDRRLGRSVLQASGALMLAFAVLQAWPGRGFWQGKLHGQPGSLTAGITGMAAMRQPAVLHGLLRDTSLLTADHGFAVNLVAVIVLAATGGSLLTRRAAVVRPAAIIAIALCAIDWLFVQDLGFLGGLGTDPNSMVPQALILTSGLMAMAMAPAALHAHDGAVNRALADTVSAGARPGSQGRVQPVRTHVRPGRAVRALGVALGMASTSSVLALWAGAMVLLGAVPMGLAMMQGNSALAAATLQQVPEPTAVAAPPSAVALAHSAAQGSWQAAAFSRSEAAAADGRAERRLPGIR